MKVDRLEIGDKLAELAEVVEYHLATAVRDGLLAQASPLEEIEKDALDGVKAPTLLVRVGERGLRGGRACDGITKRGRVDSEVGPLPHLPDRRFVWTAIRDEVEELAGGLSFSGAEEVRHAR